MKEGDVLGGRMLGISALADPFLGEGVRTFMHFVLVSCYRRKVILALEG